MPLGLDPGALLGQATDLITGVIGGGSEVATVPPDGGGAVGPVSGGGTGLTGLVGSVIGLPIQLTEDLIGTVGGIADIPLSLIRDLTGVAKGAVPGQQNLLGFDGGNGSVALRTVIQRLDMRTGKITTVGIFSGKPFMMNKDVTVMKSTLKKIAAVSKRVPRKTRKESMSTKLKDAAVDATLRSLNSDDCCPPKC